MNAYCKSFSKKRQTGNALIYVLIVVALFGALSFLLARQTDTSETGVVGEEKINIYAGQLISSASQLKQAVDMMQYSGSAIDDLDFVTPDDEPAYSTAPHIDKVFHPEGGAVILPKLPTEVVSQFSNDPIAKWYIGRFNNVEWTPSIAEDVILVAHQISPAVCAKINETLTGSATIPALGVAYSLRNVLIDDSLHSGANTDFDVAACAACEGVPSLCITNNAGTMYSFYSIVAQQ
ncbi:MAG: hypothetical protein H6868_02295 [Rhodospirillales bacterium]|nr:hypothetical protein [Rhodospirillales bacterium]